MITKKVVFVLGAGASISYGFPSGADLISMITSNQLPDELRNELWHRYKCRTENLQELADALLEAAPPSIDFFLSKHKKFADVGRAIIAYQLLHREVVANLTNADVNGDWLRYLWGHMLSGCEQVHDFSANQVSFVTFNYERSLERTLLLRLSAMFSETARAEDIRSVAAAIAIVHVHGSLGRLAELAEPKSADRCIPYGGAGADLSAVAKQIKLIGEHDQESQDFSLARKLLAKADVVYFLGFGFHAENVANLRPANWYGDAERVIIATMMGMTRGEQRVCRGRFPTRSGSDMRIESESCLQSLRTHIHRLL